MAPELIRTNDRKGTREGDVYSFAIICSELLNRENAWNGAEKDQEIDGMHREQRMLYRKLLRYRAQGEAWWRCALPTGSTPSRRR